MLFLKCRDRLQANDLLMPIEVRFCTCHKVCFPKAVTVLSTERTNNPLRVRNGGTNIFTCNVDCKNVNEFKSSMCKNCQH